MKTKKRLRYGLAYALAFIQEALTLPGLKLAEWMYRRATKIDLYGAAAGAERVLGSDPDDDFDPLSYDPWGGEAEWDGDEWDDDDDYPEDEPPGADQPGKRPNPFPGDPALREKREYV